jgi:hypothetical protein
MQLCEDTPWEWATNYYCSACEDGTMHRAGRISYATQDWWVQCSGLIWKVEWALTCKDCNCILSRLPQHHRWAKKTKTHRVTKKRSWQKTSTTWLYLGHYSDLCSSCGLQSNDGGPQLARWRTHARTPSFVLPDIGDLD